MTYGPNPWVQKSWDARAAGNFIAGGAGAGLLVFLALSRGQGASATLLWFAGMGLVATGLLLVWLEIGRPWRALNVFINPRTSWMSREAYAAVALLPVALLTALGVVAYGALVAALALGFIYCQARMLRAAKGIVAWREPMTAALIVLTGLVEGGGLFALALAWQGGVAPAAGWSFAGLVLGRTLLSRVWRRRLAALWAPRPQRPLQAMTGALWHWGGVLPLLLAVFAIAAPVGPRAASLAWALAGLLALAAGVWFKFHLVTRAAFNQGFALTQLPVRGARRATQQP